MHAEAMDGRDSRIKSTLFFEVANKKKLSYVLQTDLILNMAGTK